MRNEKIIPGLVLVLIGVLILLHNFGHLHFSWWNIFRLWPIFLVIGGVNLIFAHNRSVLATVIKIAVILGGFAFIIFYKFDDDNRWWPAAGFHFNTNDDDSSSDDDMDSTKNGQIVHVQGSNTFTEPYNAAAKIARLNISGGATTYTLSDTTNQLLQAQTTQFYGRYKFDHHVEDSVYVMDFVMKGQHGNLNWGDHHNQSNKADIKLNVKPIWEVYIEAGATKLDFDLSKFKIKTLDISGGAAAFNVKLGQPLADTKVDVSSGVSSVTIRIPANAACHITTSTGLTDNQFEGFNKNNDGTYETAGFGNAKNKIFIDLSGGLADFKVLKY
jgi:hypothetical protein